VSERERERESRDGADILNKCLLGGKEKTLRPTHSKQKESLGSLASLTTIT